MTCGGVKLEPYNKPETTDIATPTSLFVFFGNLSKDESVCPGFSRSFTSLEVEVRRSTALELELKLALEEPLGFTGW